MKQYFDDLLRQRQHLRAKFYAARSEQVKTKKSRLTPKPMNELGYIDLPQANFAKMVQRIETPDDVETIKDVYVQYLGHRNLLPQKYIDTFMTKAVEVGGHERMFEFLKHHAELLYHPSPAVVDLYLQTVSSQGYDALKKFFYEVIKGRYMLSRATGYHKMIIEAASAKGDKQTVIDAYLDVLDYSATANEIDDSSFYSVFEAVSFKETVDHVLVGHLKEQMDLRKIDSRLHMSVYYLNV